MTLKIGDRVTVAHRYPHQTFHGATGTVVGVDMFIEVKLDDKMLHIWTANIEGIGLFMEDELAPVSET